MPYIRRDEYTAKKRDAKPVYADPETEKMLTANGFVKAPGAPYYNYMGTHVDVVVYDDGTWEPNKGTGFLPDEWKKMRMFVGVRLKDFVPWLKQHYSFIGEYCANLNPDKYRKDESFTFVKVHRSEREYAWFIQHFSLLGSDDVIPADEGAQPRQYWFHNGKYYESKSIAAPTGDRMQFRIAQAPDQEHEIADSYLIERIKAEFSNQKSQPIATQ